jgi:ATP-dependent DNA helicase RecQ
VNGVQDDLLQVLERYWGYTSFRPLQREAMDAILDRRDSVVVLPTGGGKSLCFQAPALVRQGLASSCRRSSR